MDYNRYDILFHGYVAMLSSMSHVYIAFIILYCDMITTPQSRQYGINHHFRGHVLARRWRRSKDSSSSPAGWPNIRIELRKTLQIWHYEKKWWFHCTKTTIEPHDWTINKWGFMFWLLKKHLISDWFRLVYLCLIYLGFWMIFRHLKICRL